MAPQMQPRLQLPISPAPRQLFPPKTPSISDSVTCESDTSLQPEPVIFSAFCMFDFASSEAGLLSFRKNEILDIIKCADGWWAAMRQGESILGWIPETFVTPLTQEMTEKLRNIPEELRGAELKRVQKYSAENTGSLRVVSDDSARLPLLVNRDLANLSHDRSDIPKGAQKSAHPPQPPSHSRISPTTSIHHQPLPRSVSPTKINYSLPEPNKIDDTRLRGGSIRSPRRHPVIVDDDVTLSRISTLIRSPDFEDLAASHRDTPFRAISSEVFKPEKDKVQGKVIEPRGQVINIGCPPSDETPWHLRPQYADQLDIDDKGNVRSGSLLSLFEMLTFPPKATKLAQYKKFTKVFLMTFRTFMTADLLLNMLVERFYFKPHEILTDSEYLDWKANIRIPVQRLVLGILSTWLEDYQLLEEDPHIVQRLRDFLTLISPYNTSAAIIFHTIDMKSTKPICEISSFTPRKPRKCKINKLDLVKLDAKIIGDQLTVYEFCLYAKITPQQCLSYVKTRTGNDVAKLRDFCSTHDKLGAWVKMSILNGQSTGKRARTVDFWIKVAERCRALNNISSMSAIITALSSTVITGLQLSWAHTCRKSVLDGLLQHSEPTGGFAGYRILLQQAQGPCVPFITMFLTEMVHVDQFSATEGRISFYQQTRWFDIITAMLMFQSRPYNIAADEPIINFIEGHLQEGSCCDPGWVWRRSLELQRAEVTHADIRRGLEAAGF